jgi:hypothetical protein
MTLLGVRTLEGFGVMVDNIGHRFGATTTIVAVGGQLGPLAFVVRIANLTLSFRGRLGNYRPCERQFIPAASTR